MKHLLYVNETYRVASVPEVEALHQEFLDDPEYDLVSFSYKTKYIKKGKEIIEEYQVVSAKKVFNDEKDPDSDVQITYEV